MGVPHELLIFPIQDHKTKVTDPRIPFSVGSIELSLPIYTGGPDVGMVLNYEDWSKLGLPLNSREALLAHAKIGGTLDLENINVSRTPDDPGYISTIGLKPFRQYNLYISLKSGVMKVYSENFIPEKVKSWAVADLHGGQSGIIAVSMPNGKKYRALVDISQYGYVGKNGVSDPVFNNELSAYISTSTRISISDKMFDGNSFIMADSPFGAGTKFFDLILGRAFFSKHDVLFEISQNRICIEN